MTTLAAAGGQATWYLSRGTGAVALILLTGSVVLGVLGPLRASLGPRVPRFAVEMLHRYVSLLVLVLLALHIATSVLDGFAPIGWLDAVVPLHSAYRPIWLGLGALACDLLLAIVATSLIRRRLGLATWRAVHWLAYASWPVAVLHGLGTGTDAKAAWNLVLTVVCGGAVLAAVLARLARAGSGGVRRAGNLGPLRGALLGLALLTPAGLAVFELLGPLQPHWARRAGTPITVLAAAATPRAVPARTAVAATGAARTGFSARLSGREKEHAVTGGVVVDMTLRLSGAVPGTLRVRLAGAPLGGGGLSLTGSQVDLGAIALPAVLSGTVTDLNGARIRALVRDGQGDRLALLADLTIDGGTGQVSGTLDATPA